MMRNTVCRVFRSLFLSLFFALSLLARTPRRIISLAPSLTQSIYALQAEDRLIGCTSYCKEAIEDGKVVVGTATKVNVEKVASMRPDLVLVSSFTTPDDVALLRKFVQEVLVLPSPRSYDELCSQFVQIGDAVGMGPRARQIVVNCNSVVQKISKRREEKSRLSGKNERFFFQIGSDPLFAVIPGSFMADYAKYLHVIPITDGLSSGLVTEEYVVRAQPDVIVIATMGTLSEVERLRWLRMPSLPAGKSGRVFVVDATIACEPSPVTFAQTMTVLDKLLEGSSSSSRTR